MVRLINAMDAMSDKKLSDQESAQSSGEETALTCDTMRTNSPLVVSIQQEAVSCAPSSEQYSSVDPLSYTAEIGEEDSFPLDPSIGRNRTIEEEAVFFDELSEIQSRYDRLQGDSLRREEEEAKMKNARRMRCKIAALVLLCLFIGGVVGAAISISRAGNSGVAQASDSENQGGSFNTTQSPSPSVSPISPQPTLSLSPTVSAAPSQAPSCAATFELVTAFNISGEVYSNFRLSPDGSVVIMTHQVDNLGDTLFYIDTYDIDTDGSITQNSVQHDLVNVNSVRFSTDGRRLVVGARSYGVDLGGALLVYERAGNGWQLIYEKTTGGGQHGSVFDVATDASGFTFAVTVGVAGSDDPCFARVYRVSIGDASLRPMGQTFVDSSISKDSLIALSGDGQRLFLYSTPNDQIRVFEYILGEDSWQSVGEPLTWLNSTQLFQMQVSNDGTILLLIPIVSSHVCYLIQQQGETWKVTPLDWPGDGKRVVYQFGSISGDGTTIVISATYFPRSNSIMAKTQAFVFQERIEGWTNVDKIELPDGEGYNFQGVWIDYDGSEIVAADQRTLQRYDQFCSASSVQKVPSTPPAPIAPAIPTAAPTCANASVLVFAHDLNAGANIFSSGNKMLQSSDHKFVIPNDGSFLVVAFPTRAGTTSFVNTYDLLNASAPVTIAKIVNSITSLAISDDGQVLVAGVSSQLLQGQSPIGVESYLLIFRRNETMWEQQVKTSFDGIIVDAAISSGAGKVALVTVQTNGTTVAAFDIADDAIQLTGNIIVEEWLDANTTIGFAEDRLFVASSDEFIRMYDLDGLWREVGEPIPHSKSTMVLASTNKFMVITSSSFEGVAIFEFQDSAWQALELEALNGLISSDQLSGTAVSSDGTHILVTENIQNTNGTKVARLFSRTNDTFFMVDEFEISRKGEIRYVKLSETGEMIIVMSDEIVVYERSSCFVK